MAEAQNQLIEDILSHEEDRFKLVLVGDSGVGKSSFLMKWIANQCPEGHIRTIFDHYNHFIETSEERKVLVSVWDTAAAGLDQYSGSRIASYNQTGLFLVCFAVISPPSLASVHETWVPEIRPHCPDTPILLLGLKGDLRGEPQAQEISANTAQEIARDIGAVAYHEVSNKTGEGLQETLQTIASCAPPQ